MGNTVQMMDFKLSTYESAGSLAEIEINTKLIFTDFKAIQNIDVDSIKNAILQNIALQSITLKENDNK